MRFLVVVLAFVAIFIGSFWGLGFMSLFRDEVWFRFYSSLLASFLGAFVSYAMLKEN